MQTFLLLALSATASAYIATPSFLGGKIGNSAAIARSSEFGLRLRQGHAARMAPSQIQMMAAAAKKKSVADLTRRDLEGKKVCRYSFYFCDVRFSKIRLLILFCWLQVLIRCDLNVPLEGKKITDDTRIRASVPTIKYLLDNGARVAVSSHLGRPKGGPEDKYSLAPCAGRLSELIGKPCVMTKDCIGEETATIVKNLKVCLR